MLNRDRSRLLVILCFLAATPATAEKSGRAFRVAGLVAEQVLPGARPQVTESRDRSAAFELVGEAVDDESPLILMVTGEAVGTVLEDWRPVNPFGGYRPPQLVVGLRVFDRVTESLRCGLAILEPVGEGQSLVFGGLRELVLVDADTEPRLCGTLVGLDDLFLGAGEGEGHDGLDEILVELPVADLRLDAESPAWSVETSAFAWTKGGPLFTELSSTRVVRGEVDAFAWLERSGIDDEELVLASWERPPAELPALLAGLQERHPVFRPEHLEREGSTVRFESRFEVRTELDLFLQDLGGALQSGSITVGIRHEGEGAVARVEYVEVTPGP